MKGQTSTTTTFHPPCLALVLVALLAAVSGTDSLAADRYRVEVLVFRQNSPDGGEVWPPEPGQPDYTDATVPAAGNRNATLVDSDELELTGARNALAKSGGRPPVYHAAWEQEIVSDRRSRPVHIVSPDGTMDGIVRVDRGRYLHMYLDLVSDSVRLKQKRRMRSKRIHYFDHPRMGVITLVTPVEKS